MVRSSCRSFIHFRNVDALLQRFKEVIVAWRELQDTKPPVHRTAARCPPHEAGLAPWGGLIRTQAWARHIDARLWFAAQKQHTPYACVRPSAILHASAQSHSVVNRSIPVFNQ